MGYLEVMCGQNRFSVEDVDFGEIEHHAIQPDLSLGTSRHRPASVLKVMRLPRVQPEQQLLVVAYGAPSLVRESSAVCFKRSLVFIVGSFAVRLSSSLDAVLWQQKCDVGSCFGIYPLDDDNALIIHGELAITKLSGEGNIVWQAVGKDAFTGLPTMRQDDLLIRDARDTLYAITFNTGSIQIVSEGASR